MSQISFSHSNMAGYSNFPTSQLPINQSVTRQSFPSVRSESPSVIPTVAIHSVKQGTKLRNRPPTKSELEADSTSNSESENETETDNRTDSELDLPSMANITFELSILEIDKKIAKYDRKIEKATQRLMEVEERLSQINNLSVGFISSDIQRNFGSNEGVFLEGNSQMAIFEKKTLSVGPKSPEDQSDKPKTQVSRPLISKKRPRFSPTSSIVQKSKISQESNQNKRIKLTPETPTSNSIGKKQMNGRDDAFFAFIQKKIQTYKEESSRDKWEKIRDHFIRDYFNGTN